MAYCTSCGRELPNDAQFCTNCGAPVRSADPVPNGVDAANSPPVQQIVYVKKKTQTKEEKEEYKKYIQYTAELENAARTEGSYDVILAKYGQASNALKDATEKRDAFLEQAKNSSDATKQKLSKTASATALDGAGVIILIIGIIILFNGCMHYDAGGTGAGWVFTLLGVGLLGIGIYRSDKAKKALRECDTEFDELEKNVERCTNEKNRLQPLADKITFVKNYEKAHPEGSGYTSV